MCIFVVFVYLSYCPRRACVFATVGGVVVSNEQRKLLSHPVVILKTSDRILYVFVFVCVYSFVCVLVFDLLHIRHTQWPFEHSGLSRAFVHCRRVACS